MVPLSQRCRRPELMDQPGLSPHLHTAALRGLARLNLFGSARVLWPPLAALARRNPGKPLRVLDLAAGGGDVPLGLWRRARKAGIDLRIDGCDISPLAVEHASKAAASAGADLHFFVRDVLRGGPLPGYDAAVNSTFLHHLDEAAAAAFLRLMAETGRLVLVNDLERGALNLALVFAASWLVTTSPVVHTDGVLSVRAAFTVAEARGLAERAGLHGARVGRRWPCRFLLTWERP